MQFAARAPNYVSGVSATCHFKFQAPKSIHSAIKQFVLAEIHCHSAPSLSAARRGSDRLPLDSTPPSRHRCEVQFGWVSSSYRLPQMPEIWGFPVPGASSQPEMGPGARSMGKHTSVEGSTVTEHSQGSKALRRRRDYSDDESSRLVAANSGNGPNGSEVKFIKTVESNDENIYAKPETEARTGIDGKLDGQNLQPLEPPKQDYIHVRARRGQATDSHSLAERARREKISERMKILQDIVPGCNKVIGKASVLDEIINYIQALQHQVEFLSMKLEAVNSLMNTSIELFPPKDAYDTTTSNAFSSRATMEYEQCPGSHWLQMQLGGAFERVDVIATDTSAINDNDKSM